MVDLVDVPIRSEHATVLAVRPLDPAVAGELHATLPEDRLGPALLRRCIVDVVDDETRGLGLNPRPLGADEAAHLWSALDAAERRAVLAAAAPQAAPVDLWARLRDDPAFAAAMAYCGPKGIPYEQWLGQADGWTDYSRRCALTWQAREAARCGSCGQVHADWLDAEGNELRIPPFAVEDRKCLGCESLHLHREDRPEGKTPPFVHPAFVPTASDPATP